MTMKVQVKVKPNSRISTIEELPDGSWLAKLQSPPVNGKANKELIELIARQFAVSKSQVAIKSGASGRTKIVEISG